MPTEKETEALKDALLMSLNLLPQNAQVAFITFGTRLFFCVVCLIPQIPVLEGSTPVTGGGFVFWGLPNLRLENHTGRRKTFFDSFIIANQSTYHPPFLTRDLEQTVKWVVFTKHLLSFFMFLFLTALVNAFAAQLH